GRNLLSVGYDSMQIPATIRPATIASVEGGRTFTRERPWHGRSGGALLDADAGYVIGVVQGYEVAPWGRGIYISHSSIVAFLKKDHTGRQLRINNPLPQLNPFRYMERH